METQAQLFLVFKLRNQVSISLILHKPFPRYESLTQALEEGIPTDEMRYQNIQ